MHLSSFRAKPLLTATAASLALWLLSVADWLSTDWLGAWRLLGMACVLPVGIAWLARNRHHPSIQRWGLRSGCFVFWWPLAVAAAESLGWAEMRSMVARAGVAALFLMGLAWVVWYVERASQFYLALRRADRRPSTGSPQRAEHPLPSWPLVGLLGLTALVCALDSMWWHAAGQGWLAWLRLVLLAGALVGLVMVWGRWAWRHPGIRNPLDLDAWYYGRRSQRLSQSLAALGSYSALFLLLVMLFGQLGGCREIYEMPAGGGRQVAIAQTLKVQKVVKKKFIINPFSAIIFNPPPIDEIKLQLLEVTAHQYAVGYGQGEGAGFAGGTNRGKVRFIRLEYPGGDWDQDFGVGGDLNMLVEYGVRTRHAVHNQTESRSVGQLAAFPAGKSPPLVYLTGQRAISLSKSEIKILRDYLLEKHGMIFGDNGGSWHFHNQFFSLMQQVLPTVEPVKIPLDDVIHRTPYALPFLPYVAPHGGREAWGWKVDGRWVGYYHPGDIGDAWTDDHSGVEPDVYEACYQLGTNIIFYAHVEYSKWLSARHK